MQGSETSGEGWQVEDMEKFQMDNVTHRDRMWGEDDIKIVMRRGMIPMGGGEEEEEIVLSRKRLIQVVREGLDKSGEL